MIEYLYDAIRAVAGQDISITAKITDDDGNLITEGCKFVLHLADEMNAIDGTYYADIQSWIFTVPAALTKGYIGKHYYCIQKNDENLCFKTPIFLV